MRITSPGADAFGRAGGQLVDVPVGAQEAVDAGRARLAAREPEGRDAPVVRENRDRHRRAELDRAHEAVAAAVSPAAAGAAPVAELAHQHRVPALQHLGIGEARVRHVRLHARGAVEAGPRARAAGDRLVVLVRRRRRRSGCSSCPARRRARRARRAARPRCTATSRRCRRRRPRAARGSPSSRARRGWRSGAGSPRSAGTRRRPACGTRRARPRCRPRAAR